MHLVAPSATGGLRMTDENERHNEKMRKIKAARDKMMESKTEEKGLIIVHTGAGKGKSSSGFGMIMRCIAHQIPCAVVQFIKGNWDTGEKTFLRENYPDACRFFVSGEGFTWETQDRERDIAAAQNGWRIAKEQILDPEIQFVLLDEINIALRYDYLDIDEVVEFLLSEKPHMTHVCLTGRNAKPELIEAADLVTEMSLVKHPFRDGVKAQKGIEF
jgi:cob(I)alamin adenosyltransferase